MTNSPGRLALLEPKRVCIIKPSSLGDVVHALPILAALRARWPSAHLAWVVNRPYQDLLLGHPDLDELIVYDRAGGGITGAGGVYQRLSRGRFDLTIDLQGLLRSALMTAATRTRIRVGMADAREGARWFYTDLVDAPRLRLHAVERVQRVARALGADASDPRFHLPIRDDDRRWARETLAGVPSPRIVLNLGARWRTKRWPPEHYAELARRASAEFGAGVIAVGADGDRPHVEALKSRSATVAILDLCGRTRLLQLAAVATLSDLFISNDTGPMHLAAAAGASVIGIYTCTDPRLTGPYGPRVATLQSCVWCAPSFLKRCRRLECMDELTPERVWPVVKSRLETALDQSRNERESVMARRISRTSFFRGEESTRP
jgi:lipopolysaccharide heptosyltransferase I